MYKKDKRKFLVVFFLASLATYFLKLNMFAISSDVLSVLSIILGFYFTALSVQMGNKMTVRMSHQADVEYPTISQLKVLLNYFKFVFVSGFGGIMLIIFAGVIPVSMIEEYAQIYRLLEAFAAGIVAVALVASFVIFQLMANSIQEEAIRLYQENQRNRSQ